MSFPEAGVRDRRRLAGGGIAQWRVQLTASAPMPPESSPDAVVQRQLDAYNAHDLDAWIATYAPDAQQFEHPAKLLASGADAIRARAAPRFAEPDLHAHLLKRTVAGHVVIDHEVVTRNLEAGVGSVEMVCIYVVKGDHIQSASFVFGSTVIRDA